jgi:hypothetical protein
VIPVWQGSGRTGMGSTLLTGLRLYGHHLIEDTAALVPALALLGVVLAIKPHPALPHPAAVGAIQVSEKGVKSRVLCELS